MKEITVADKKRADDATIPASRDRVQTPANSNRRGESAAGIDWSTVAMGDAIRIHRRRFLAGVAATTGAFALGGISVPARPQSNLPRPELSDIEHVVL